MNAIFQSPRLRKIGLLALPILTLAAAYNLAAFAMVSDPRAAATALAGMGVLGYAAFLLAYAALQPFGVPGSVFIVIAPLIWPSQVAFALSLAGTMLASVVGFSFARFVARDWVSTRIPERFRKYDAGLERDGFLTVVLLRLIFWMPQPLHFLLGVSRVGFGTHFWGSLVGYVPPLLIVSYFGSELLNSSGSIHAQSGIAMAWMIGTSLLTAALATAYARHRRLSAHA